MDELMQVTERTNEQFVWSRIGFGLKQTFQFADEPEFMHVLETGFKDLWMLIFEDAYEHQLGEVQFHTRQSIEEKFGIKLYSRALENSREVIQREIGFLKRSIEELEKKLT
jgi:hypothetical protein